MNDLSAYSPTTIAKQSDAYSGFIALQYLNSLLQNLTWNLTRLYSYENWNKIICTVWSVVFMWRTAKICQWIEILGYQQSTEETAHNKYKYKLSQK